MIKKILFHINSLGKGGAERVIINLSEEMAALGKQCVIATIWKDKDEYPLSDTVRRIDVGVGQRESEYSRSELRNERKRLLKEAILKEKPDVIISFCRNANYRAILAAEGTGVPVFFSVRSDPKTDYASIKQKAMSTVIYSKAKGAVFQTDEAKSFFPKSIQKKATVILNPLNPKYMDVKQSDEIRPVIVSSGRFHEAKDQLVLVKAFQRIAHLYPHVNVEFYGAKSEDDSYEKLIEYVKRQHLEGRVLFKGNSNELEKLLPGSAVYVLSSKYEGMPNALMEAMAMGLPVVSTDCPCGGPRMLIDEGVNGYLVPVGDVLKMSEAIQKMLDDPEKALDMGRKASNIRDNAAPEIIAKKWLKFMEEKINSERK